MEMYSSIKKKLGAVFNHRIFHEPDVFYCLKNLLNSLIINMVAGGGIEPPTQGFSVLCSTD
jgi:hypothetical protein